MTYNYTDIQLVIDRVFRIAITRKFNKAEVKRFLDNIIDQLDAAKDDEEYMSDFDD